MPGDTQSEVFGVSALVPCRAPHAVPPYASSRMPCHTRMLPHAACSHAAHTMLYAVCCMLHAVCPLSALLLDQ
eukprot:11313941-Heterocapsa_arctica.AAC.1